MKITCRVCGVSYELVLQDHRCPHRKRSALRRSAEAALERVWVWLHTNLKKAE